jgi:hypothetical protein
MFLDPLLCNHNNLKVHKNFHNFVFTYVLYVRLDLSAFTRIDDVTSRTAVVTFVLDNSVAEMYVMVTFIPWGSPNMLSGIYMYIAGAVPHISVVMTGRGEDIYVTGERPATSSIWQLLEGQDDTKCSLRPTCWYTRTCRPSSQPLDNGEVVADGERPGRVWAVLLKQLIFTRRLKA